MSTGGTKEGLTKRDIPSGAMTPMRARASPAAPRRLVVSLDLDAEDVPCVNYKKLLKEQGGAGASSRPSAEKGSSEKLAREAAAERMKDGHSSLLEAPTGGGGHMAAVIRRIEALYQGGRGNASSDEEEDEEEDSDEEEDEDGEEGEEPGRYRAIECFSSAPTSTAVLLRAAASERCWGESRKSIFLILTPRLSS